MGAIRPRLPVGYLFPLLLGLALSGCELDEVTLAQPEDIPVVEAYIRVGDGEDQISAFVHWTLGTRPARDLLALGVSLTGEDGVAIPLFPEAFSECLREGLEEDVEGVCYSVGSWAEGRFEPGTRVELEILFEDGGVIRGATVIPDSISLIQPAAGGQCALPPGRNLEFVWSRSPGVWAYSAETEISDLRSALASEGIVVETDSVALLGSGRFRFGYHHRLPEGVWGIRPFRPGAGGRRGPPGWPPAGGHRRGGHCGFGPELRELGPGWEFQSLRGRSGLLPSGPGCRSVGLGVPSDHRGERW